MKNRLPYQEPGFRPGMVSVKAAMLFGREVPGLYVAKNRLLLGRVDGGKFVLDPSEKTRFYNLRIRWKLFAHRFNVFFGRC